jgi:hypothetical protein
VRLVARVPAGQCVCRTEMQSGRNVPPSVPGAGLTWVTTGARFSRMSAILAPPAQSEHSPAIQQPSPEAARRRFTQAVIAGILLVTLPYLWILWVQWDPGASFLRVVAPSNFYDLQARAMFSGHLYVPNGALGIEAFVHSGRQYTYFGLFPSLLRMPILIFTHALDGRLTGASILLAWLVTAVFSSVLLWRLRLMTRGQAALGWAEAASYGLFVATITGGSVLVALAAEPWVYNEDFAWSVALTIASLFALLGVLERPSWGRVLGAGVLILAANLDRAPTGYACVIGAGLIAVWFKLGREGEENRRWFWPMLGVAVVPFAVSCAVTYAKFGIPVGLPMADQVWAHLNEHRRYFLAANGGKAFSPAFVPTTAIAYLQPFGIRFSDVFPFITNPTTLPTIYAGAVFDQTYQTASIPSTMPLLFLLSCWGTVSAFRPRPVGRLSLTRIPLLAAIAGTAGVLMWGYIADRYMADFMPFLILAGAIGMIDLWRRIEGRSRRASWYLLGGVTVLAAFSVVVNMATAVEPNPEWTTYQFRSYLAAQDQHSVQSVSSTVHHGATLPYWAPAGQIFDVGNCSGLYYSTGETYNTVPGQQDQHLTWKPVTQQPDINHTISITVNNPNLPTPVPLLTYGKTTLVMERAGTGYARLRIENPGGPQYAWPATTGGSFAVARGYVAWFDVMTDPNLHSIVVRWAGAFVIGHYLAGDGPAVVQASQATPGSPAPSVTVSDVTTQAESMYPFDASALPTDQQLCRTLTHS